MKKPKRRPGDLFPLDERFQKGKLRRRYGAPYSRYSRHQPTGEQPTIFITHAPSARTSLVGNWLHRNFRRSGSVASRLSRGPSGAIIQNPQWRARRIDMIKAADIVVAIVDDNPLRGAVSFDLEISRDLGKKTIPIYVGQGKAQILPSGLSVVDEFEFQRPDARQFRKIVDAVQMNSGLIGKPGKNAPTNPSPQKPKPTKPQGEKKQTSETTDDEDQS